MSRKDHKGRVLRKGETQRTKDRMYVYTYNDVDGKRKSIYNKDIAKLREREDMIKKNLSDGLTGYIGNKLTINQLYDKGIELKRKTMKERTYSHYQYLYDMYLRNGFGRIKLINCRYSNIKAYYNSIIEEDSEKALSKIKSINALLRIAFDLAVRDGYIKSSPLSGIFTEVVHENDLREHVRHALTIKEEKLLCKLIQDNGPYGYIFPIVSLMLSTGLRVGEAISLRWESIDFDKRVIKVNTTMSYFKPHESACQFVITAPKTKNSIRDVPMSEAVYKLFSELKWKQKLHGGCETKVQKYSGFIFTNSEGRLLTAERLNDAVKKIINEYNELEKALAEKENREPFLLPHISNHIYRHTFCTRLCESTDNIKAIQSIMGHSTARLTMDIYAEATEEAKELAIKDYSKAVDIYDT